MEAIDDQDEFWGDMTRCLTPLQRAVILWRYRYGFPDDVLANALGKTLDTIQSNRVHAIKKMKAFFGCLTHPEGSGQRTTRHEPRWYDDAAAKGDASHG